MYIEVMVIALLAGISPGPDFFLVTKNALGYGRKIGIASSLGIAAALAIHASYAILGLTIIMQNYRLIFEIIQLMGAAYLGYLGISTIISTLKSNFVGGENGNAEAKTKSFRNGFVNGFLCNILNPKAYIFFLSIFSQFMSRSTQLWIEWIYGLEVVVVIGAWFILLSFLISSPLFKNGYNKAKSWVERVFGIILVYFALKIGKTALMGN
jgi:RhtB (resistance to homoserine/threonine) family protein